MTGVEDVVRHSSKVFSLFILLIVGWKLSIIFFFCLLNFFFLIVKGNKEIGVGRNRTTRL